MVMQIRVSPFQSAIWRAQKSAGNYLSICYPENREKTKATGPASSGLFHWIKLVLVTKMYLAATHVLPAPAFSHKENIALG
jgi:hypothetical protein